MSVIDEEIEVDAPLRETYDQWTQFEEFPVFMEGVEEVRQLDDTRLHWVASIAGVRREWDARITQQIPDQLIAWTSMEGTRNDGLVTFDAVGAHRTHITLRLDLEPDGGWRHHVTVPAHRAHSARDVIARGLALAMIDAEVGPR